MARVSVFSTFIILCYFVNFLPFIGTSQCPVKGKENAKFLPNILSLVTDQTGYKVKLEIVMPLNGNLTIEDNFDTILRFGSIVVHSEIAQNTEQIYYYHSSDEAFTIINAECETRRIISDGFADNTIKRWLPKVLNGTKEDLFLGDWEYLGPVAFMVHAYFLGSNAQYIENDLIDGLPVDHWFHCLTNDGPYLDYYFDKKTQRPIRLTITLSDGSIQMYNFLSFKPIMSRKSDPLVYPIGFGCKRLKQATNKVAKIIPESGTFQIKMEASVYFKSKESSYITSLDIIRYQDVYSFLFDNNLRIVFDSRLNLKYTIQTDTGSCSETQTPLESVSTDILPIAWPYNQTGISYNLLKLTQYLSGLENLGTIDSDQDRLNIRERIQHYFLTTVSPNKEESNYGDGDEDDDEDDDDGNFNPKNEKYDVIATYYIPTSTGLTGVPSKIKVKTIEDVPSQYPTQFEINIIDYSLDEDKIEFADRFDVSNCYLESDRYTWFQIVYPSSGRLDAVSRKFDSRIEREFFKSVASFIPKIRLPEVRVSHSATETYVTGKLLERPKLIHLWEQMAGHSISNPTKIITAESAEDCEEICATDHDCRIFAYCSHHECQIFSSTRYSAKVGPDSNCTRYATNNLETEYATQAENNVLISSRRILHEIKAKIVSNQLSIYAPYKRTPVDLFVVPGPDSFGGLDNEFNDNDATIYHTGRNFDVILNNHRLTAGKQFNGATYKECAAFCDEDNDCSFFSFCPLHESSCIILGSNKTELSFQDSIQFDGCNVLKKNYISWFIKSIGQSVPTNAMITLSDTTLEPEECAKTCLSEKKFKCQSFDVCSNLVDQYGKKIEACFLHTTPKSESSDNPIDRKKWNFSGSLCTSFTYSHSYKYKEIFGRKIADGQGQFLQQLDDISLEKCAVNCDSTLGEKCQSYEYCQSIDKSSEKIKTRCRLSTLKLLVEGEINLEATNDLCSVYVSTEIYQSSTLKSGNNRRGLIIGLSLLAFFIAFIASSSGLIYFRNKW